MKKIILIIFLFLSFGLYSQKGLIDRPFKEQGICLTIGGVAFTTAAILEGSYQYGTYKDFGKNSNPEYVIPPFIQQSPRSTMLIVGLSLTITGLFEINMK